MGEVNENVFTRKHLQQSNYAVMRDEKAVKPIRLGSSGSAGTLCQQSEQLLLMVLLFVDLVINEK